MLYMEGERSQYRLIDGALLAGFQPGDATRYNFMWVEELHGDGTEFLIVAGTPDLRMYEYNLESIKACYERCKEFVGHNAKGLPQIVGTDGEVQRHPYIGYIQGHSGKCNPWTAWAMVQCIAEYYEEKR